jgi:hypothetical protein
MELDSLKQQHEDQAYFKELLRKLRAEEHGPEITEEDAKFLCQFCVNDIRNFCRQGKKNLENADEITLFSLQIPFLWRTTTTNVFTENTRKKIQLLSSNHLLLLRQEGRSVIQHFQRNNIPAPTKVCIGAKVQLKGKNIRPSKGLHNGSMGKVVDIVFAPGHNPNNGDFPLYIIVSFPQYDGPSFFPDKPNWVPLVSIESRCKFGCCLSKYFPLQL